MQTQHLGDRHRHAGRVIGDRKEDQLGARGDQCGERAAVGDEIALRRADERRAKPGCDNRELEETGLRHDDFVAGANEHAADDIEQFLRAVAADNPLRVDLRTRRQWRPAGRRSMDRDSDADWRDAPSPPRGREASNRTGSR